MCKTVIVSPSEMPTTFPVHAQTGEGSKKMNRGISHNNGAFVIDIETLVRKVVARKPLQGRCRVPCRMD